MKKKKFESYVHQSSFKKYYQFKINLVCIGGPPIWRRIQVPQDYTFWDLHVAITDCMPWLDYHLHEFIVKNPRTGRQDHIGAPDDDGFADYEIFEDIDRKLSTYFSTKNSVAEYMYDFGDGWAHEVLFEGAFNREPGVDYPRCVAGENACPPEDVGGMGGYGMFLKVISRPNHAQREEQLRWAEYLTGRYPFDPEHFDVNEVRFDDPDKRWHVANGGMDMTPDMRLYDWGE